MTKGNGEKKVLYFDYWTVGIHNFKLFDSILKGAGYHTKLFHIGSWRDDKIQSHQEILGIECNDITHYGTMFIHDVLEKERPILVVMLNATLITDRTVILSCKKLGIKTIYLAHGALIREEFIETSKKVYNQSFKGVKYYKAFKHLRGTVLNFLNSTIRFDLRLMFSTHPYKVLLKTLIDPGTYLFFPPASFDLKPDLTLVYGNDDAIFFGKRLLIESDKIKIIGNPELDNYFQNLKYISQDKEAFLSSYSIPSQKPYIVYIEEGTVEEKLWDNETRLQFISEINGVCKELGLHLVIKLHPRTAKGPNFSSFSSLKDVTVLQNVNFPKLVFFCEKCVSHFSTTLIYPMLLDKPILVPKWGKSSLLFSLNSENEVSFVNSLEEFKRMLTLTEFHYNRSEYLDNFVPYRDGKTGDRIANYITSLIN